MHLLNYKYYTVLSDGQPHYYTAFTNYFQAILQSIYVTKVHPIYYFVLLAYKSTYHTTNFLSNISTFHYQLIIVTLDEATYKILKVNKTIKLLIKYH